MYKLGFYKLCELYQNNLRHSFQIGPENLQVIFKDLILFLSYDRKQYV